MSFGVEVPAVPTYRHPYRRPGVCSECGCAVVQPAMQPPPGVWAQGHLYGIPSKGQHSAPVLLDVRCERHRHESDPSPMEPHGTYVATL